jgi:hypothetical protein
MVLCVSVSDRERERLQKGLTELVRQHSPKPLPVETSRAAGPCFTFTHSSSRAPKRGRTVVSSALDYCLNESLAPISDIPKHAALFANTPHSLHTLGGARHCVRTTLTPSSNTPPTHAHTHPHTRTHTHPHTHRCAHTQMHAYVHTHIHTHTHVSYTHAHIQHTQIQTRALCVFVCSLILFSLRGLHFTITTHTTHITPSLRTRLCHGREAMRRLWRKKR